MEFVDAAPSGACTANELPRYVTTTNQHCACESGSWSCKSGGSGVIVSPVDSFCKLCRS